MTLSLVWLLIAAVLLVAEMFTGTVFLAALGVACLLSAGAAALGLGFALQVAVFGVSGLLSLVSARWVVDRFVQGKHLPSNAEALLGTTGWVREGIGTGEGYGRVSVRGDDWRALSGDGRPIEPGTKVFVVSVDGVTLTVIRDSDLEA